MVSAMEKLLQEYFCQDVQKKYFYEEEMVLM